jgi:hypothetical protein
MPKFYDDWITSSISGNAMVWKLNLTPEEIDSIDPRDIWKYSIDTVNALIPNLGTKSAVCFSGGIDSQVMVDCFIRAGVTFDVVIMRFPDDLNWHDIKTAVEFCESRDISYTFIDIDVIQFLSRDLIAFADKYDVSSPQFATHFKMFEKLQELGYTSAVCGGNTLLNTVDGWFYPTTKEQSDWRSFSERSNFYVMGDFLSYYWKFSLAFSCYQEQSNLIDNTKINLLSNVTNHDSLVLDRYKVKVSGFMSAGFDIIPQAAKFTGFEEVKEKIKDFDSGDGWAFEKRFRFPLRLKNPTPNVNKFELSNEQKIALDRLYDKCVGSRQSSTRITD